MEDESKIDEVSAILKKRAEDLAHHEDKSKDNEESLQVVEFLLGSESFALETKYIKEVYPLHDYTEVPCTPSFVMGIINLHGTILSIINIKDFLKVPQDGMTNLNKILILKSETMTFGILADDIIGVKNIPNNLIQTSFATFSETQMDFFKGMTEDPTIILDGKQILSDKRIIVG